MYAPSPPWPPDSTGGALRLEGAAHGERLTLLSVGEEHEATLAREGLLAGRVIEVETVVPFGGPMIVLVGSARVAVARSIARTIVVDRAG